MTVATGNPERSLKPAHDAEGHSGVVVWIDPRHALLAGKATDGPAVTMEIDRGSEPESRYLTDVVRAIGDAERVAIIGPTGLRLAVEREYVALHQRPDRLTDLEPSGVVTIDALVDRVAELVG